MAYKVDWRDEKEKERDGVNLLGLMFAVPPRVTHPSDKLLAYFQPCPRHFLTSACHPAAPLPCFLFVVSFSNFSLPSSSCALPSLILSLNGESCEQAMQMRWLLPHCSSSRAEETLIG